MINTLKFLFYSFIITIFLQFVGFIWYGPLFGRIYLNLAHPHRNIKSPHPKIYLFNFIYTLSSVVLIYHLASTQLIISPLHILNFSISISIIIGIFRAIHDLFDNHPLLLNLLHSCYNFVLIYITTIFFLRIGFLEDNFQNLNDYVPCE